MKKLITAIVAIVGLVITAQAQVQPLTMAGTPTSVNSNVTWTTGATPMNIAGLTGKSSKDLGLQLDFKLYAAGNSNITFTLQKSLDATTWMTLGTITVAANGTNTVTYCTNYTMGAVGYARLYSVANANNTENANLTNLVVKWRAN